MKNGSEITKRLFLLSLIIFIGFHKTLLAQADETSRPKLKDFGSSLKNKKAKKNTGDKRRSNQKTGEEIIKVNTDLVVSDVLVLDEKGIVVKSLTKDDFIITENDEVQDVEIFALGSDAKIPRSIVLLIDHSASQLPFIVNSIISAKILVDNLNPGDRMAIVTDDVKLLCDFTRDKKLLKDKLESLKPRMIARRFGESKQYSALIATFNELFSSEDIRRIVILQTDGDQINLKHKKFDVDELKTAMEKSRASVYSIFPGLRYEGLSEKEKYRQAKDEIKSFAKRFSSDTSFDLNNKPPDPEDRMIIDYYEKTTAQQVFLKQLSQSTGAWLEYLETPVKASQVYSKILESINDQYVLGYYPKNQAKGGKRRTVKITVKNHPEYQIEGRKTYFAEEQEN